MILLYLESFGNPRQFTRRSRAASGARKPIVAVKAGRSGGGRAPPPRTPGRSRASDAVVDALFRQAGVIRTDTLEELFDVAVLLAHQPMPQGPRVAILTNAGGPGILAADACEAKGLELAYPQRRRRGGAARVPAGGRERRQPGRHARVGIRRALRGRSRHHARARERRQRARRSSFPPLVTDADAVAAALAAGVRTSTRSPSPRSSCGPRRAGCAGTHPVLRVPGVGGDRARTGHDLWREAPTAVERSPTSRISRATMRSDRRAG